MASSELRQVYRELVDTHVAMRAKLDEYLRLFKREFKKCRPEDEAALAAKFQMILDCMSAGVAAGGAAAEEKLRDLDA
jgi:hypothetical protein